MEIIFVHRQPKNIRKSLRMYIVDNVRRRYFREICPRGSSGFSYTELFRIADIAAKNVLDSGIYPTDKVIFDEFMEVYHAEQKNMG